MGSDFICCNWILEWNGAADKSSIELTDLDEAEALSWKYSQSSGLCGSRVLENETWHYWFKHCLSRRVLGKIQNAVRTLVDSAPGGMKAGTGKKAHWACEGFFPELSSIWRHPCLRVQASWSHDIIWGLLLNPYHIQFFHFTRGKNKENNCSVWLLFLSNYIPLMRHLPATWTVMCSVFCKRSLGGNNPGNTIFQHHLLLLRIMKRKQESFSQSNALLLPLIGIFMTTGR